MDFLGYSFISLVVFCAIGLAVTMGAACLMLLRDVLRSGERIRFLEAEVERLGDTVWDLRESEERSRSLVDGQGDILIKKDGSGRIAYVNDAFVALAGLPRESILGTSHRFDTVESGEPARTEAGIIRRDEAIVTARGVRWIEWQDVPVRGSLRSNTETLSVGRDVTARREAERAATRARDEAQAATEAKSRFLATVSHEIRTPLSGTLGMAGLLLDTKLTPEQISYVNAIRSSGEALLSLIDEILNFSKIEARRLDLDEKPFEPRHLVEVVVELMGPRAHARGLDIAASVAPDVPSRLLGDAPRLQQVIINLVGNAIKFTHRGGVSLRLRCEAKGGIAFDVIDTGVGIAPESAARIFDEFEQVDQSPARRTEGVGLGLAISQRLVQKMGGRIRVTSTPGIGSHFTFVLQLPAVDKTDGDANLVPGKRVLIVSPSPITGPALATMLDDNGSQGRIVATLEAALAELSDSKPDIVLIDRALGFDVASSLCTATMAKGLRSVVLLTPGERGDLAALTAKGAAGWLIKPVRAASLFAQISHTSETLPAPDPAPRDLGQPLKGRTILLAEDNDINALVARSVLTKSGAEVVWARDGDEAVAAFKSRAFDAVLMDMRMPGLDGLEATRQIRAFETGSRTPIHALTANAAREDLNACLAAGMDGAATKPLDRDALVALLTTPPAHQRRAS